MSSICINLTSEETPELIANIYYNAHKTLDFLEDMLLWDYVDIYSETNNIDPEDIEKRILNEYTKLVNSSLNNTVSFEEKGNKNDMNDVLEEKPSLMSSLGITAALWNSFSVFAESKLKLLNWRYPGDELKPINNETDLNEAIKQSIYLVFKDLILNAYINPGINVNMLNMNNIYDEILAFFANGKHAILESSKYFNHYLFLKNPDTAILLVLADRVKVPTGYFNVYNNNKLYRLLLVNSQHKTWNSNEEDLDDMQTLPKVVKAVFESIPRYEYIGGKFIKSNKITTHNGIISGYNLLLKYQYDLRKKNEYDYLNDKLSQALDKDGRTLKDLLNILEEYVFEESSGFVSYYSKLHRAALENLYSLYQFLKLLSSINGFDLLLNNIYLNLQSTTHLKFGTYEYNKDGILVYKEYDPFDSDKSLSIYSRQLALDYSNNQKWFDFTIDNYNNQSFTIPGTDIEVKLQNNNGILVYTLKSNEQELLFTFIKTFGLGDDSVDLVIKNGLISKKDLATLLRIPYTELFESVTEVQPYILALDLIKNCIANQLIHSANKTIVNPVYGSTIATKTEFENQIKRISGGRIQTGTAVDIRNGWVLQPYQVNFFDIYKPAVYVINTLLHKPMSTMVKTLEGTTLNLNKSFQRGNVFYESTVPQRLDPESPSNHFIIYLCFVGGHVVRDVKNDNGEVKKAINFNPEEHLTASFIYDYLNRLSSNEVSLMGPIVSDKSWIPRIDTYINKKITINGNDYNLKNLLTNAEEGSTQLLRDLTAQELFAYYSKQAKFVITLADNLNTIINSTVNINGLMYTVVDLISNILLEKYSISVDPTSMKSWFKSIDYKSFNQDLPSKSIKERIIHELIVLSLLHNHLPKVDWIDNLCNCWEGSNLSINRMLAYNLERYDKTSTEFNKWFAFEDDLFISDLIKNGFNIKGDTKLLDIVTQWKNNAGYHIYAKVKFDDFSLDITNNVSLDSWNVYRELKNAKRFFDKINEVFETDSIPNNIFIDSAEFSITDLINFLNTDNYVKLITLYRRYQEYKKEQKDNDPSLKSEDIIKSFVTLKPDVIDAILVEEVKRLNGELIFNPILLNYNLITNLFEEEFLNATVGTYLTHPTKVNDDIKVMIKNARGALVKRNVILSATKTKYLTGRLRSIPDKIKIAIIENLSNDVFNLLADELGKNKFSKELLTDDGATLVDGAFLYLENYSLGENAVGLDKKQFGSYVNVKSGSGFILKTAGFAITNDLMRRSPQLYNLSKRMRSLKLDLDLNLNDFRDVILKLNLFKSLPIFDAKTGTVSYNHYKLIDVGNDGLNWVKWAKCDEFGNLTETEVIAEPVTISTIWELYENVLGGIYTSHLSSNGLNTRLTSNNCDSSNVALVEIMCTEKGNHLKDYLISYAPTREAVKYGISNPNTKDVYTDSKDYTMSYMEIDTFDLGILLDAEHSAFESRVSLMTLVMNAAAARGYSIKEGDAIYNALHKITLLSILDCFDAFSEKDINVKQKAKNLIAALILDVLKSKGIGASNLLDVLTSTLHREFMSNLVFEHLISQIPIDDPSILRLILSKFTSSLQSHAIRLKLPGGQYVLAPSDGRILLWAGKTLDEYGGKVTPELIKYLNDKTINGELIEDFGKIKFGRSYRFTHVNDGSIETFTINNPNKYWEFKRNFKQGEYVNIKEDFTVPYDLGCEDIIYTDTFGESYHIWDLYEVWNQWDLMLQYHLVKNNPLSTPEDLEVILDALKQNQELLQIKLNRFKDSNEINEVEVVDFSKIIDDRPTVKTIEFDRANVDQIAFEAILPKYLKKRFNLTDFDNLSDIKNNPFFFYKKSLDFLNNFKTLGNSLNAHVCLIGAEFNTYLQYTNLDNIKNVPFDESLFEEINVNFTISNGEKWLLSNDGLDLLLKLPIDQDVRILRHKTNNTNVIITKDIKFFVDLARHTNILFFTPNTDELKTALYEELTTIDELLDLIEEHESSDEFWDNINNLSTAITELLENIKKAPSNKVLKKIRRDSFSQHGALLDSLNFIASRTPAQCHLSFMAMNCIAFDHSERNVAYVSRWLLWLQGSDFDKQQC